MNSNSISSKAPVYALPAIPLALMAMSYYVFLPKYLVDYQGFPLMALSLIILLSRIWDAVLDPLIGRMSDRSHHGKPVRKKWIAFAVVPLAVSYLSFFFWPAASGMPLVFFICSFVFFVFFSAVLIPFEAWGITLAGDYDQRNTIMSWREGFVILGTFLSGLIPFLIELWSGGDQASVLRSSAIAYSALLLLLTFVSLSLVKEKKLSTIKNEKIYSWGETMKHAWGNTHFRVLVVAYILSAIGAVIPATLILFYIEHVLQSSNANLFLSLYFLSGMLALPVWIHLSRSLEKRAVWLSALAINTGSFFMVYFLAPGQELAYGILVVMSGLGFGATMAIPSSMQADVIDYDEYLHGKRREGVFVGLWAVARKLSAAVAAAIALQALAFAGYVPGDAPDVQAREAIRIWYTLVPCLFNFLAIAFALRYLLDRREVARIQLEVSNR